MSSLKPLPENYSLIATPPPLEDYLNLRLTSGLTPKSPEQGSKALGGSWYTVHIVHTPSSQAVGMGRVIGDGGWYFHIVDMAVHPNHQRKGLGDTILANLLAKIEKEAPEFPYVNLIADPPGKNLYKRHGFVETSTVGRGGTGMERYKGRYEKIEGS